MMASEEIPLYWVRLIAKYRSRVYNPISIAKPITKINTPTKYNLVCIFEFLLLIWLNDKSMNMYIIAIPININKIGKVVAQWIISNVCNVIAIEIKIYCNKRITQ